MTTSSSPRSGHIDLFTSHMSHILTFFLQGKVKVDSIDDAEELEFTDVAFDTLGFSPEEKVTFQKNTKKQFS